MPKVVISAKVGIHFPKGVDSCLRRNDSRRYGCISTQCIPTHLKHPHYQLSIINYRRSAIAAFTASMSAGRLMGGLA